MFDPLADIAAFHKKFKLDYDGPPRILPLTMHRFRCKFLDEELREYVTSGEKAQDELTRAPLYRDYAELARLREKMLDALVDLVYVDLGTAHLHGFNFEEAWRRVHEANMKKKRAKHAGESLRGSSLDVIKPKGWQPPSLIDLV